MLLCVPIILNKFTDVVMFVFIKCCSFISEWKANLHKNRCSAEMMTDYLQLSCVSKRTGKKSSFRCEDLLVCLNSRLEKRLRNIFWGNDCIQQREETFNSCRMLFSKYSQLGGYYKKEVAVTWNPQVSLGIPIIRSVSGVFCAQICLSLSAIIFLTVLNLSTYPQV